MKDLLKLLASVAMTAVFGVIVFLLVWVWMAINNGMMTL